MELASYYPSDAWNFEVVPRFLENLCTSLLECLVFRSWIFQILNSFKICSAVLNLLRRLQLKCDGTRWRTGKGSEGETGEWSGYPVLFTLPRNMVYPALLALIRTPRLPAIDWTDAPDDLNGLVRFAERWNLVSARVSSHFKRSLPTDERTDVTTQGCILSWISVFTLFVAVTICNSSYEYLKTFLL